LVAFHVKTKKFKLQVSIDVKCVLTRLQESSKLSVRIVFILLLKEFVIAMCN